MKVRIKDWWDMAEQYGVNECGNIDCCCSFTSEMREYCGKVIEVEGMIFSMSNNVSVFVHKGWFFSDYMYEVIEE